MHNELESLEFGINLYVTHNIVRLGRLPIRGDNFPERFKLSNRLHHRRIKTEDG